MADIFSKFFGFFKSNEKPSDNNTIKTEVSNNNSDNRSRTSKLDFNPIRKIFLWGLDDNNNPSFLVLYGKHNFKTENFGENEFEDNVSYTDYIIFRGEKGHFPSFEAVKVLETTDYSTRITTKNLYYKKDINSNNYYYSTDKEKAIKDFITFEENDVVSLPYFEDITHEDCVNYINSKKLKFNNFTLAKTPSDVLNLSDNLSKYYYDICNLFGNPNIYMRKKYLKQLIQLNPPKEFYDYILTVGSGELISGLFLELSLQKNDMLINEAQKIINADIEWLSDSYAEGLKRCALLYINSFDEQKKTEKINFIRENLSDIDLHLLSLNGTELSSDTILEGRYYINYFNCGCLSEYTFTYSYEERKHYTKRRSNLYKKSYYSDGVILNINNLKSTIQESEIFGLADVIGKIAYYLDAPRLTYHLKANRKDKALMYFRRYLRRIMDSYAQNDEDKFIEAMKILFTSYTNADYLDKYNLNFQYNYFIKHYLYYDFINNNSENSNNKYGWLSVSELLKSKGRYEFMPEIWDRHLDVVIDILSESKVDVILKAFYYILEDYSNKESLVRELSYERIIRLVSSDYQPVADYFTEILNQKIRNENAFDMDIMLILINCPNKSVHEIAMNYFNKTGGKFSTEDLVSFMFFKNFEEWKDLLEQNLETFTENEYAMFLHTIFSNINKFIAYEIEYSEELKEVLDKSLNKLNMLSQEQMTELLSFITAEIIDNSKIPSFILQFMEDIVFSNTLKNIESMLENFEINYNKNIATQKGRIIVSFLNILKNNSLPNDAQIIEILEFGTARMIKILIQALSVYREKLNSRFSTLLIMLESDVTSLNELAKSIFENLPKEEQKKLHSIIIDSPDKKVYDYGIQKLYEIYEEYGEVIPEDFVIQMLEHSSYEVKSYISNKIIEIINNLGNGNKNLFMYYAKTLLFLPNKVSKVKNNIYDILPVFVYTYRDKQQEVEEMLLDIGYSNIILDSERALVALAKIKKEAV